MTCWPTFRRVNAEWIAVLFGGMIMGVLGARSSAQTPEWIWRENKPAQAKEVCFFRKQFSAAFQAKSAELTAAGDDEVIVYLNGREVARSTDWNKPVTVDVTAAMREGSNVLAVRGRNGSAGAAAVSYPEFFSVLESLRA